LVILTAIRHCIPQRPFKVSRRRNKKRQSRSLSLVELSAQTEGKRMKRREFLRVGGIGLAASTVAAPAVAQSMPEVKWRLAASWPKSLDTLYGGCEYFCKRVAEITDNRFQIQSFAAGEIVPGLQVLDAVSNGTVEIGNTALYYYWGKNAAFTFGTALPFGLNTRQHISWLLWGGGQDLLNDLLREQNVLGIPTGSTGAQMGGWSGRKSRRSRISRD
jgi:TRAP-type mannitol/chloroaromatic compound transport system substrate-binding protein